MKTSHIINSIEDTFYLIVKNNLEKSDEEILKLFKSTMVDRLLKTNLCSQFSTKLKIESEVYTYHSVLSHHDSVQIEDHLIICFGFKRKWNPFKTHMVELDLTLVRNI